MRHHASRRRRASGVRFRPVILLCAIFMVTGLFLIFTRPVDRSELVISGQTQVTGEERQVLPKSPESASIARQPMCATVEEMGKQFESGSGKESLRVRRMIKDHFSRNGAVRVRELPPDEFCKHGFIMAKASEAGIGNEMYKILSAAALSLMLNRSLIIGQTRGKFPFGDYITYTNLSLTLREVKHLWRQNKCVLKHRRHLVMRIDDFENPASTNVLCSDWRRWKEPIIWFQGTTDAVGVQFFLKNVHSGMQNAAAILFGETEYLQSRPNVFGELMQAIISPSRAVQEAVDWALGGKDDPDISVHMRMLGSRPVRAIQASLLCIKKALQRYQHHIVKPRVALVSDTPSVIEEINQSLSDHAEVIHFDYKMFKGNITSGIIEPAGQILEFRRKDWGPMPRWVAFVDFFLASRAKYAVVSGAHRRVATTYAQLLSAFAAARQLDDTVSAEPSFSFFSSFHSNLLAGGLADQVGWGHAWNRFSGPKSCRNQTHQCAFTPLLPSAWWDAAWQSPISRDVRRLQTYGVRLMDSGKVEESHLLSFCRSRRDTVKVVSFTNCKNSTCT
ncbi:unnamed protein product [Victoria cruziana]